MLYAASSMGGLSSLYCREVSKVCLEEHSYSSKGNKGRKRCFSCL